MKRVKGYYLEEEIGEGSFGRIYKAQKENGDMFAVKEIKKLSSQFMRNVEAEIKIAQQKLNHRNIVQILEHFTENKIYIVMEYCEKGNLNDYIVQEKPELCQRISFLCDMAYGVNYLHSQNIIHRDLKPENVLLTNHTGNIICKISDFGVATIKLSKLDNFMTFIGSQPYIAPEITGDKKYSSEVDVFSLGLLFYCVFENTVLTNDFGDVSLIPGIYLKNNQIAYLNEELKKENPSEEEFLIKYFKNSSPIGKFIFSMVHMEPASRPKMDTVLVYIIDFKAQHELNEVIQNQEKSIIDLHKQNEDLKTELHQLCKNCEQNTLQFQTKIDKIDTNIHEKDKAIDNFQKQISKLTIEKETVTKNIQELELQNEKIKEQSQKEIRHLHDVRTLRKAEKEQQLQDIVEQNVSEERELKGQTGELQNAIMEMNRVITNLQKQNSFLLTELPAVKEAHEKEKQMWVEDENEKGNVITELENRIVTQEQELRNIRIESDEDDKGLHDDLSKDSFIWRLKKQNENMLAELQVKDENIFSKQNELCAMQQETKLMKQALNDKEQEKIFLIETLNWEVLALLAHRNEFKKKDQEILSLEEELREKDKKILSLETAMENLKTRTLTLREETISGEKLHQSFIEASQTELKQKEIIIAKLTKEKDQNDNALLINKNRFEDVHKKRQKEIEKKEVTIIEKETNIKKLNQHIDELQKMMNCKLNQEFSLDMITLEQEQAKQMNKDEKSNKVTDTSNKRIFASSSDTIVTFQMTKI